MSRSRSNAVKSWDWGLILMLVWGAFSPASIEGVISSPMVFVSMSLLVTLCAYLVWRHGSTSRWCVIAGILVLALPLGCTALVEGKRIAWGKAMFFVMLGASYFPRLRDIKITRATRVAFSAVSLALLAVAAVIVVDKSLIEGFLVQNYSEYYAELLPNMLHAGKPVGTFASHNVAALFYYFFFYLHLRSYSLTHRLFNLALAVAFLVTILFLKSNTCLVFSAIGFLELFNLLWETKGKPSKVYAMGILVLGLICMMAFSGTILETAAKILGSDANGLAGRFSRSGNMRGNFEYLMSHPFAPVGFQYRSDLFYGDCGYIEMLLRGSLPLLLAAYGGLVMFLKQNVRSSTDFRVLLTATLVMEIGFSNLISVRFLFLMPFVIVYLNGLQLAAEAKKA